MFQAGSTYAGLGDATVNKRALKSFYIVVGFFFLIVVLLSEKQGMRKPTAE